MTAKFFTLAEFECKCGRAECDAAPMDSNTLQKLEELRGAFGKPMKVLSGSRCAVHNASPLVKGSKNSQHMLGRAVDIFCPDGIYMRSLIIDAMRLGFTVGVKKHMLHLDTRQGPAILFGY